MALNARIRRAQAAPIGITESPDASVEAALRLASSSGSGQANEPPQPRGLAYPSSSLSLSLGTRMTPAVPTLTEHPKGTTFAISPALPNATVAAISLAPDPRAGILTPDNPSAIPYRCPEFLLPPVNAVLDVYLPAGTPPANGWPVLISNRIAGWAGAPLRGQIDPSDTAQSLLHKAVNAGIAVVDQAANSGGALAGPFARWFYPPGHESGKWEEPNQFLPEWEVLNAIQWVAEQSTYLLDPQRIFCHGVSAGATIPAWIAAHPELAFTSGSSHIQQGTALRGILCFNVLFSYLAYEDDWTVLSNHFESVSTPGTDSIDMADADQAIRDAASVARTMMLAGSRMHRTPMFIACDEDAEAINFATEADGHPEVRNLIGTPWVHDLWNSGALMQALRQHDLAFHQAASELHVGAGREGNLSVLESLVTGTFTVQSGGRLIEGTGGTDSLWDTAVAWMVARSEESFADPTGLSFRPWDGCIYGTPNTAGSATHVVTATNANGSAQATVQVAAS